MKFHTHKRGGGELQRKKKQGLALVTNKRLIFNFVNLNSNILIRFQSKSFVYFRLSKTDGEKKYFSHLTQ